MLETWIRWECRKEILAGGIENGSLRLCSGSIAWIAIAGKSISSAASISAISSTLSSHLTCAATMDISFLSPRHNRDERKQLLRVNDTSSSTHHIDLITCSKAMKLVNSLTSTSSSRPSPSTPHNQSTTSLTTCHAPPPPSPPPPPPPPPFPITPPGPRGSLHYISPSTTPCSSEAVPHAYLSSFLLDLL